MKSSPPHELLKAEVAEAMTPQEKGEFGKLGGRPKNHGHIMPMVSEPKPKRERVGETDPIRTLQRLKRDRPDLAEKVVKNEMNFGGISWIFLGQARAGDRNFQGNSTSRHQAQAAALGEMHEVVFEGFGTGGYWT